ncbi:MAG: SGNH/GDSL hydrolase family protein [Thermomicrobiales bacterium]
MNSQQIEELTNVSAQRRQVIKAMAGGAIPGALGLSGAVSARAQATPAAQDSAGAIKNILCYGDSNTYGQKPIPFEGADGRFAPDVRWTGVLQRELGDGYHVIEEGLNGRTTIWEDIIEPGHNGKTYFQPCLESHLPLDMVTIMLGTNDLKARFDLNPSDIAQSAAYLAAFARGYAPVVLMMIPPPLTELSMFDVMFEGGIEKSQQFAEYYPRMAALYGVANVFDAGSVIVTSPTDGIHFEADQHAKLGQAVAEEVRRLIG